jgi:predicted acetyltransferase
VPEAYDIGPIRAEEARPFLLATVDAFQEDPHDEDLDLWTRMLEPERALAARSGGAIVATSALFTLRLAVPGGVEPMAGVTAVGVDPVHRRRGLLDRMMRAHLAAIHERGEEALSALWASEAGIYGRWGFGQATRIVALEVRSPDARLLAGPAPSRPRGGEPAALLGELRAIYDALLPGYPGLVARTDLLWEEAVADFEHDRDGYGRLRGLVTDGGYALYAVKQQELDGRLEYEVRIRELLAATPAAHAVLWEHLLGLSLTRTVSWPLAPEDEPLTQMLTDSRAVRARLDDGLFVRLVDVGRALTARTYGTPVDVVLDVADPVCGWNAGRWRLAADATGAMCERTEATADLALSATELGAAYLGGTPLTLLAAAGRVEERTRGALAATSRAFRGLREPWCPAIF